MKKIIILSLFYFIISSAFAELYKREDIYSVLNFISAANRTDKERISKLIIYPLQRSNPLPEIKNRKELLKHFDEIFDSKILKIISKSDVRKNWHVKPNHGLYLESGDIWLDFRGKLIALNYLSDFEKKEITRLISIQKKGLYTSLRNFSRPVLTLRTKTFVIRIDDTGNERYRLAYWKAKQKLSTKPIKVLENGELIFDGNGGNRYYQFKTRNASYICYLYEVYDDFNPTPASFTIKRGERDILNQNAKIIAQ